MKLNAPDTWCEPDQSVALDNPKRGRVRVTCWSTYHFRQSVQRPMASIRVEGVEQEGQRRFKPWWLAGLGQTMPLLDTLWLHY